MQSSVQNKKPARGHVRWLDHIAPNVDPKVVQNVYKAIGSTEGAKRAVDDVAKAEARASEAEAKSRGGPKAQGPRSPPPKVAPTSAPSYSSSSSSAAAGPAKAKPAPKQMPTSAKSSRPSPQTNHNQHLSTRRNALIDVTYSFSFEPVTLSERPVLMMPGHYVVYSIFIDEHHKD